MSDLTRRVLDAHQTITDAIACDWNEIDRARDTLEDAAPILARQVEAIEALADRLDHEAETRRATRQDPFEVMTIRQEATRIRNALQDAVKTD